ncbi:hypothetical protein [Pararobbsia silviterrae]|uniref:Scaffold protein FimL second domain-containing protein n=1 Tax=Pararobbsia silviterrae TaxID=1792498 RepID=A0A494Y8P6_9BURK|nr:hypothetical protein [Pararobbsia silviterrae]RKP59051.1 hypothetical protein D7S86_03825 [Pararobbsia silviterrae]
MDASSIRLEIGFNPHGGALPDAEQALADARAAVRAGTDPFSGVHRAAAAFRTAGWMAAVLFTEAIDACTPIAHIQTPVYDNALYALSYAVSMRNLRALTRSPSLFECYRALRIAAEGEGVHVGYETFAMAGRIVPNATLARIPERDLGAVRERYETALLGALRGGVEPLVRESALVELEWCASALAGPEPLDMWRLAGACLRVLRERGMQLSDDRRLLAGFNMLLADQAAGATRAPRELVRSAVALLWRASSPPSGNAATRAEYDALLRDYGVCVGQPASPVDTPETLWEEAAARDEVRSRIARGLTGDALEVDRTRYIGPLVVAAGAYEDFLATADASMVSLSDAGRLSSPSSADAAHASEAAFRMAAASAALGLGQVGLLADALALVWRMRARAVAGARMSSVSGVSSRAGDAALSQGTDALRGALLRIAAGIPPLPLDQAIAKLGELID